MLTVTECYKVLGLYLIHLQGGHNICFVSKESRGLEKMDGCPELTQKLVCVLGLGFSPRIPLYSSVQWKHSQARCLSWVIGMHSPHKAVAKCNMKTLCKVKRFTNISTLTLTDVSPSPSGLLGEGRDSLVIGLIIRVNRLSKRHERDKLFP